MSFITDRPVVSLYFEGKRIKVNPSFDTVLDIQKMYGEKELTDFEKAETALHMLVLSKRYIRSMSKENMVRLLSEIYLKCVNVEQRKSIKKQSQPVLDFELDAEYIYASFMSDYQIDLVEQQGKLSWRKFIYLFQGLTDKCKIKEVMRIRSMELPKPTRHNQKDIQNILELKAYYALPVKGGGGKDGLNRLFDTLERLAVKQ